MRLLFGIGFHLNWRFLLPGFPPGVRVDAEPLPISRPIVKLGRMFQSSAWARCNFSYLIADMEEMSLTSPGTTGTFPASDIQPPPTKFTAFSGVYRHPSSHTPSCIRRPGGSAAVRRSPAAPHSRRGGDGSNALWHHGRGHCHRRATPQGADRPARHGAHGPG